LLTAHDLETHRQLKVAQEIMDKDQEKALRLLANTE